MSGPVYTPEEMRRIVEDPIFQASVVGVIEALATVQREKLPKQGMNATVATDALAYLIAAYCEAHPEVATNQRMRLAAEGMGKLIHQFMVGFRRQYEATGEHQLEKLGVFSTPEGSVQ